jgi:hypothetical protein
MGFPGPQHKERCTFEHRAISVGRNPQPVEESFNGEPAEHSLIIFALLAGEGEKLGSDGCRRDSCWALASQCLHVWANDIADAANLRVSVDVIDARLSLRKAIS